ncbi:MAG: hypothetical protein U9P11_00695 [Pseudomonadota bacterium]|nr:hypothetical protein [Pseudomonadota bacterium]
MIQLTKALGAWETPVFEEILKDEIEQMDVELLPLQQGLSQCSYASGDNLSVVIISVSEAPNTIRAKTGIFYTGLIPGCSCADDPTPVNEYTEYCVVQFDINRITAETRVTLLPE